MAETRTLQFLGYAYGNTPVLLNAHINGNLVFSGAVTTIDTPIPDIGLPLPGNQVLFSATDPSLSTDFEGALPMTISVANGYGVWLGDVNSNYMLHSNPVQDASMEKSSIDGTTLTIGTLASGTMSANLVISSNPVEASGPLPADQVLANTLVDSGSDSTWTVNNSQTVSATTLYAINYNNRAGNATSFLSCYDGTPTNSEGTPDPRSSVTLDGVQQVPPKPASQGVWTWVINSGSTLACNLNVSLGNVANVV